MEDFILNREELEKRLNKNLQKLNNSLEKSNIIELMELLGNKKKMFVRNFIAGISKGIGIGIGFTLLSAIIVIVLQKIVTLNLPVIGDYIADIVDIVESK